MRIQELHAALFAFTTAALISAASAQVPTVQPAPPGDIKWNFGDVKSGVVHDSASSHDDAIQGFWRNVPGVKGGAVEFDGMTTHVMREPKAVPKLGNAFTVSAWMALDNYPWNWVPIADQSEYDQVGYNFSVDALGHIGFGVSVDGMWQRVVSSQALPLKKWSHVTAAFDGNSGLRLYINGLPAGALDVRGNFWQAVELPVLVGRVRNPTVPFPVWNTISSDAVKYSLDGYLAEVDVLNHAVTANEDAALVASTPAPQADAIPWAVLPAGPAGKGPFGAFYAQLKFTPSWDRARRTGEGTDVVVRFEHSPMRLVFWQGNNFVPAWVTENGKWLTNEFLETWGEGCPGAGDCEPMSDKQVRYSRVSILSSSDARTRIHWRYADIDARTYDGGNPDPLTGWFDWADEYWTVYPDGVAVRKSVLHSSAIDNRPHEWQETIVIHGPGQRPEDNIEPSAVTLVNMAGETHTYTWQEKKDPKAFTYPVAPSKLELPEKANMQMVHLKSAETPFQIVWPKGVSFDTYNFARSYSMFVWWNHWPVAQIGSSERMAVAPDRPSHSSLSHIYWDPVEKTADTETKLMLGGLTTAGPAELVRLGESWLSPPDVEVPAGEPIAVTYDPSERAYVVCARGDPLPHRISFRLNGAADHPLINPAIVVRGWTGPADVSITIAGKKEIVPARTGSEDPEGVDSLVIYAPLDATVPVQVEIGAVRTKR